MTAPLTLPARVLDRELAARRLLDHLLCSRPELVARAFTIARGPGGRGWLSVAETLHANAWLIAWNPGSRVGSHDHGGSHGVLHVLRGELVESFCEPALGRTPQCRSLAAGATIAVPPSRVHDVANDADAAAFSLHVYSPALTTMSFYPSLATVPAGNVESA